MAQRGPIESPMKDSCFDMQQSNAQNCIGCVDVWSALLAMVLGTFNTGGDAISDLFDQY